MDELVVPEERVDELLVVLPAESPAEEPPPDEVDDESLDDELPEELFEEFFASLEPLEPEAARESVL